MQKAAFLFMGGTTEAHRIFFSAKNIPRPACFRQTVKPGAEEEGGIRRIGAITVFPIPPHKKIRLKMAGPPCPENILLAGGRQCPGPL
jgi:hypothetical protein